MLFRSPSPDRSALCERCHQEIGRRASGDVMGRVKRILNGLFGDDYDPWKVEQWYGTQEERNRLEAYAEQYRMTTDETVTMSARAPW